MTSYYDYGRPNQPLRYIVTWWGWRHPGRYGGFSSIAPNLLKLFLIVTAPRLHRVFLKADPFISVGIIPPRTHAKRGRKRGETKPWHGGGTGTREELVIIEEKCETGYPLLPSRLPLRLPIICISISATNVRCTRKEQGENAVVAARCAIAPLKWYSSVCRDVRCTWVAETCVG